jgi:Zn-finger nucleic acid-binding protein
MVEINCPWCAAALRVEADLEDAQHTCPECLTTWLFETDAEMELALAA